MSAVPDTLVTTYLEMHRPGAFLPSDIDNSDAFILRMQGADLAFYRFLYDSVGAPWRWRDRLLMSDDELRAILSAPETTVDVLYVEGSPAGYIELERQGNAVEIAYFGLRPDYMGRGLGKMLLSYGIAQAWAVGAQRVWVHTCNLDGPHALDNYLKRGFAIYDVREQPMPERYR